MAGAATGIVSRGKQRSETSALQPAADGVLQIRIERQFQRPGDSNDGNDGVDLPVDGASAVGQRSGPTPSEGGVFRRKVGGSGIRSRIP